MWLRREILINIHDDDDDDDDDDNTNIFSDVDFNVKP
jgi:hypothetical protein